MEAETIEMKKQRMETSIMDAIVTFEKEAGLDVNALILDRFQPKSDTKKLRSRLISVIAKVGM